MNHDHKDEDHEGDPGAPLVPTIVCDACGGTDFIIVGIHVLAEVHYGPHDKSMDLLGANPSVIENAEFGCEDCGVTYEPTTLDRSPGLAQAREEVGDALMNLDVVGALDFS